MCCADDKGPILAVLDCKLDCTWMDFCFCMDMYTRVYVLQVSWKKMLKKFWIKEFALKHGSGWGGRVIPPEYSDFIWRLLGNTDLEMLILSLNVALLFSRLVSPLKNQETKQCHKAPKLKHQL